MHAPHAAGILAPAAPGVQKVPIQVVAKDLVRALISRPQLPVARDDEAVDIHRRPRAEGPLVQVGAVLVEDLHAAVRAVVDIHPPGRGVDADAMHVVHVARPRLAARLALLAPLPQDVAVHVVLDDALVIVPVGQVHRVGIHEDQEGRPAQVRVVLTRLARRAERQHQLTHVVGELADRVPLRVDNPDVLLGIVGADLDVMRPHPDVVPLLERLGDHALAIQGEDTVLPSPVHAVHAVARLVPLVAVGDDAAGLPQRQPEYGKLQAWPDLRKPYGLQIPPIEER